jgi:hypothetical protein
MTATLRLPAAVALSAVAALCVLAAACGPGGDAAPATPTSTRTDSAGVEIVVSELPESGAPVFAELSAEPSLRIGTLSGAEEEQFGSIRDLAPLPGGGIAVLDQQAAQVRLFGPEGAYQGALGAKGEGPGELMSPATLAIVPGDTMVVYDGRTRRVTWYPMNGGEPQVRTLQGAENSFPFFADFFPDGRLVGTLRSFTFTNLPNEGEDAVRLDSAVVAVYSAQGDFTDTVAILPNRESIMKMMRSGQSINLLMQSTAFGRSGVFAPHPEGVWAGYGGHWELRLYDPDGSLKRIVRVPGLERPLTDAEVQAVFAAAETNDTTPSMLERRRVWRELSPRPAMRPTFDRALVDDEARIWLREWPGADETRFRWWVFRGGGELLGSVDMPAGVDLMAVAGNDAWGVFRDDFDVPYVVRYPMTVVSR